MKKYNLLNIIINFRVNENIFRAHKKNMKLLANTNNYLFKINKTYSFCLNKYNHLLDERTSRVDWVQFNHEIKNICFDLCIKNMK